MPNFTRKTHLNNIKEFKDVMNTKMIIKNTENIIDTRIVQMKHIIYHIITTTVTQEPGGTALRGKLKEPWEVRTTSDQFGLVDKQLGCFCIGQYDTLQGVLQPGNPGKPGIIREFLNWSGKPGNIREFKKNS